MTRFGPMHWGTARNGEPFGWQSLLNDDGTPCEYDKAVDEIASFAMLDPLGRITAIMHGLDAVPGQTVGGLEWVQHMRNAPRPMTDEEQWAWVDHQDAMLAAAHVYVADRTEANGAAYLAALRALWAYSESVGHKMFRDEGAPQFKPKAVPAALPAVRPMKGNRKRGRAA